jgi:uncharacterized membrane protein YqjE
MREANSGGLFASLRQVAATALEMAQVRLELLGTEIEFEKQRLFDGILLAAAAMVFSGVGLLLFCSFIILLVAEGNRLAAMAWLALACFSLGVVLMVQSRKRLKSPMGIFSASAKELQTDRANVQAGGKRE